MRSVLDGDDDPYRAAVSRAVQLVGSALALSRRLQVPMADIEQWLRGSSRPTVGMFLKIVDVVIEEGRAPRYSGTRFEKPPR